MAYSATVLKDDAMTKPANMAEIGAGARAAQATLATAGRAAKDAALVAAAKILRARQEEILTANGKDMAAAEARGTASSFLDRLKLTPERIEAMAKGLEDIAQLDDPVGRILARWDRPNGLNITRVAVPLGVIGVIYESRPNVTADAAGLCIKSGNCVILRGGSESFYSSGLIADCMQEGLKEAGLPEAAVQLIPTTDRAAVGELLTASDYVDVIIPRGGKGLIQRVIEESRIPTLQHLDGNCHSYIHEKADPQKAIAVVVNAKMRRTGVCGATESVVIDRAVAAEILPALTDALTEKGCVLVGDEEAVAIDGRIAPATAEDFDTEFLEAKLSVKIVANLEEGLAFVAAHSSGHTDAIITEDDAAAEAFLNRIDSAIVVLNASTQFADGGEFGMGAEIGIATGKLHARGPVGVEQLTTFKYQLRGSGQTRP